CLPRKKASHRLKSKRAGKPPSRCSGWASRASLPRSPRFWFRNGRVISLAVQLLWMAGGFVHCCKRGRARGNTQTVSPGVSATDQAEVQAPAGPKRRGKRFEFSLQVVKRVTRRVWREMSEDNILGAAAELGYYFLLALFPMLIFLTSLIGFIPDLQ